MTALIDFRPLSTIGRNSRMSCGRRADWPRQQRGGGPADASAGLGGEFNFMSEEANISRSDRFDSSNRLDYPSDFHQQHLQQHRHIPQLQPPLNRPRTQQTQQPDQQQPFTVPVFNPGCNYPLTEQFEYIPVTQPPYNQYQPQTLQQPDFFPSTSASNVSNVPQRLPLSDDTRRPIKQEVDHYSLHSEPVLTTPPTCRRKQSVGQTADRSNLSDPSSPPMHSEVSVIHPSSALVTTSSPPTVRKSPLGPQQTLGKRSRSDVENGEENKEEQEQRKRARGRPRLTENKDDETATARRRTQIRLAQRAYRDRKDKAITDLEGRVQQLVAANEDLNKEFANFLDFVSIQGALQTNNPEVSRRIRDLTRKFHTSGQNFEDADIQSTCSTTVLETNLRPRRQTMATVSSASSDNYTTMPPSVTQTQPTMQGSHSFASLQSFHPPDTGSYEIIAQPTPENASFPTYIPDPHAPGGWVEHHSVHVSTPSTFEQTASMQLPGLNAPTPVPGLTAPSSYAAQELTFGRRLQRTTLQRGLMLISMPHPPPARYAAVFGFCLLFESRENIIQRLSEKLARIGGDSLFHWRSPFHNLGGAGWNFPEDGSTGESLVGNQGLRQVHKPSLMTGYGIGPFDPRIEAVKDMRLDEKMRMIHPGFQGTYLDADEVEIYLRRRGICIPSRADFISVEVDPNDFDGDTSTVINHQSTETMPIPGTFSAQTGAPTTPSTTMFSDGMATPVAESAAYNPYFNSGLSAGLWPGIGRVKLTLDVNMLVNEMVGRSVCLGRTPGIRPKDIDTAVKLATGLCAA